MSRIVQEQLQLLCRQVPRRPRCLIRADNTHTVRLRVAMLICLPLKSTIASTKSVKLIPKLPR
ncbi:hypothetical protein PR202_ga14445 [Eleusine coracana subsp. coracana]|uniref:Uncharacterized protein n=1 Tax=Eleusine coracana subsp. coracana TaxID=191504 RepID=A0AAV5CHG8_ELECO|nr:hypothetical protein PR202_ga14445 [Eleusine coracana subsp. coracana]